MLVETTQRHEESLMATAAVLQVLWPPRLLLPIPDDLSKTNLRSPQRLFAVGNPPYHAPEWLDSRPCAEMLQRPKAWLNLATGTTYRGIQSLVFCTLSEQMCNLYQWKAKGQHSSERQRKRPTAVSKSPEA